MVLFLVGLIVGHATAGESPQTAFSGGATRSVTAAKTTAKPAAPRTLLTSSGTGDKNTNEFTSGANWTIHYTYDCSDFGRSGNFVVTVFDGADQSEHDPGISTLDRKGADNVPVLGDSGLHHLQIISECKWTLTVTQP
jgi:hypothetical protein